MTKTLLTSKKKRWVQKFKLTAAMRGNPLRYNAGVQVRYIKDIEALVNEVIKETEKEVKAIFSTETSKEFFATDASIASIARIDMNKLFNKMKSIIHKKSNAMAQRMVLGSDKASKSTLHQSLKELSGGLSIKTNINSGDIADAFTASVNVNVDLIKTMTGNYLESVKGAVNRSIQTGGDLETLIPNISKFLTSEARKTKNKAKNVALDQTRKAFNALNSARMQKIGVNKFEWVHSGGGQRPRKLHITPFPAGLNGGIFSLDDLPIIDEKTGERGIPGQAINCKCVMRPIITFNEGVQVDK